MRRAATRRPAFSRIPGAQGSSTSRKRARNLVARLRRRRAIRRDLRQTRIRKGLRNPQKRKKLAFALGASAMGLNTGAMSGAMLAPSAATAHSHSVQDPREMRVDPSLIEVSDELKLALIEEEGMHRTVYADPIGLLTVGVGHLVTPQDNLRAGERISDSRMAKLFEQDLQRARQAIVRISGDIKLYQHEFDALVDLAFNVGEGNLSSDKSPGLNQAIAQGDHAAVADQLAYHNADGTRLRGLEYRSDRRERIFTEARYDNPRPTAETTRT